MDNNQFVQQIVTLESLHGSVGLLRARISYIMKAVSDTRQEQRRLSKPSPIELSEIMVGAQNEFTTLLQLSDLCWQAKEKAIAAEAVFSTAETTFTAFKAYFEWLQKFSISVLPIEDSLFESIYSIVDEYLGAEEYRE
ncbi:MAG: hypothetical protein JST20_02555 [Bacteroidetes bacterium]|nr:hypothetical protein [Bacteroidota bacterium]